MADYHQKLDFTGYHSLFNPPPFQTHNIAYVFGDRYVPYFGLEIHAPSFHNTIYTHPETYKVSREWITMRIDKISREHFGLP